MKRQLPQQIAAMDDFSTSVRRNDAATCFTVGLQKENFRKSGLPQRFKILFHIRLGEGVVQYNMRR